MMKLVKYFLAFVIINCYSLCHCKPFTRADDRPMVTISDGVIVGLHETQGPENIDMYAYRGIPFAKPPVNELRFMPPVPNDPWEGELNAAELGNVCPQILSGRENCLFLNVYTPSNEPENLPVMVYFHGGGFVLGSSKPYDQVYPLVQHDVIVVNIQYRIGILGFFSTGDDVVPGNMGLKDQTLALHWVKDNIEMFGGDPNSITIFGQSAGSASVHWQVLSEYAEGLFDRYILMSGNAFMPWALGREFYDVSRDIARRQGCPEEPSYDLVKCLQDVTNFIAFNDMQIYYIDWNFQPFRFGPRIDGDFIKYDPVTLIQEGRYSQVPAIMGVVQNEMALETGEMYAKPIVIDSLNLNFEENGPPSLMLFPDEDPVNTATTAYEYYLGSRTVDEENAEDVTKMYTERCFHIPFDWLVERTADEIDLFTYEFNHRGEWGLMDSYANIGFNLTTGMDWIAHADDLQFTFGQDPPGPLTDSDDITVMMTYSKLFTNFAKYENPTPDSSLGYYWPTTNSSAMEHLSITTTPFMTEDTREESRNFWESLPLRINSLLD